MDTYISDEGLLIRRALSISLLITHEKREGHASPPQLRAPSDLSNLELQEHVSCTLTSDRISRPAK